ncbi:hypothetical protein PILCRDRAFT_822708 [Piloderma croceum F 1598]|uniref:AB hydrolase-1 domain-containing protein n=1 Tax=Piloderma croceum (strain F 1598) TaxID=765440 RepID=A0A0C3FJX5_PILCF|nr:hypothetical protein PILCRDRAFT_822708 [Piloderma croceum F 1598]
MFHFKLQIGMLFKGTPKNTVYIYRARNAFHTIPVMSHLSPVTQWGAPTAAKRALCIHGLCSSSQVWHYVADSLVAQGYWHVMAPDLIGHGMAPASKDYSIKAIANALFPLLSSSPPFDLVVGHSLGAIILLTLLPNVRFSGQGRIVLIDPPLELGVEPLEVIRKSCIDQVSNIKSVQEYMTRMNWTEADAVWEILGLQLCKPEVINTFFKQNMREPWSFTPLLPNSSTVEMVILGADPSLRGLFTPDEAEALGRTHPHIKTKIVKGASHLMFQDIPAKDLVVGEILRLAREEVSH